METFKALVFAASDAHGAALKNKITKVLSHK